MNAGGSRPFTENEIREAAGEDPVNQLGGWDDELEVVVDVPNTIDE